MRELSELGADVVIAAVGVPRVMESYLPLVRNGGVFNIFGGTPRGENMTVDPRWIHYGEIVLTGYLCVVSATVPPSISLCRGPL